MNENMQSPNDSPCTTKKAYEVPELVELGNVADLTNYDVSTMVP